MTSADATELIGLTHENFRRMIIIPQGKFKEF
jgi:exonuclease SbcC